MPFTRVGLPCAVVYKLLPNPPYWPFPLMSTSTVVGPVSSLRSTVKAVKSPAIYYERLIYPPEK